MTKISDKNIPVYFAIQEFLGRTTPSELMGRISYKDMIKMMVALEDYKPSPDGCTHDLGFKYVAELGPYAAMGQRHSFKLIDSYWGYNTVFPKCAPDANLARGAKPNDKQSMFFCAHCLRDGKCTDEFMRDTIGAVLFPQFYAKDKQK